MQNWKFNADLNYNFDKPSFKRIVELYYSLSIKKDGFEMIKRWDFFYLCARKILT